MDAEAEGEDGQKECIGAEIGVIAIDGELDWAINADIGTIICGEFGRGKNSRLGWIRHCCSRGGNEIGNGHGKAEEMRRRKEREQRGSGSYLREEKRDRCEYWRDRVSIIYNYEERCPEGLN